MRNFWLRLIGLHVLALVITQNDLSAGVLDGRWRHGTWTDDNTGHEGPLRARFRERGDGNYRVVFTGKYATVVPFRFATTLKVVGHDGDKVVMSGQSRVMGMRFHYDAVADEHNFHSQYSSRRWRGEFNLTR